MKAPAHLESSVITFNTQKGYNLDALASDMSRLRDEGHDFFLLQEAGAAVRAMLLDVLGPAYGLAQHYHPQHPGVHAYTAIAHRTDRWECLSSSLVPYPVLPGAPYAPGIMPMAQLSFGLTSGVYARRIDGQLLQVASTHLHSRDNPRVRLQDAAIAHGHLAAHPGMPLLLGGDFNTGHPLHDENARLCNFFAAQAGFPLSWLSQEVGPTCYWKDLEPLDWKNKVAAAIGRVFGYAVQIDHFYGNRELTDMYHAVAHARHDIASSDHLPVQMRLAPRFIRRYP